MSVPSRRLDISTIGTLFSQELYMLLGGNDNVLVEAIERYETDKK